MRKSKRLSGEERRAEIIGTARRLFAEKGFHATTTRELAAAAGVSEALLFKHFPSKEALYAAMMDNCLATEVGRQYMKILELPPSTQTLAALLHFVTAKIVQRDKEVMEFHQLILHSLSEDGEFAKVILRNGDDEFVLMIRACVEAARKQGDLHADVAPLLDGDWLAQHVIMMLSFMHLSRVPLAKYRTDREERVKETVLFSLRGLGFREEAIQKAYDPKGVERLVAAK
jgi:AcrR family transcriptional regulator